MARYKGTQSSQALHLQMSNIGLYIYAKYDAKTSILYARKYYFLTNIVI